MLSKQAAAAIEKRLRDRSEELRLDIQRELRKYDDESYNRLADEVSDTGDQSWAHLVSDVNLAEVTRDIHEIREIDAALQRLKEGS